MSSSDREVLISRVHQPLLPLKATSFTGVVWKMVFTRLWPLPVAFVATLIWSMVSRDNTRPVAVMSALLIAGVNVLVLVVLLANRTIVNDGLRVRIRGHLRLVAGEFGGPLMVLVGLCAVAAIFANVWLRVQQGLSPASGYTGRRGGTALIVLIGTCCIVFGIVKPFLPSGVELDEDAVCVRKGIIRHRIPWFQLRDVVVNTHRKLPSVGLVFEDGPTFWLEPVHVGSNPYYVAELILYYLRHPDRRELLRDPEAAIREVMEVA